MTKPTDPPRKKAKKLPSGMEVMKRKTPDYMQLRPAIFEFDPRKAYTADQLAEIGAIALRWNQVEAHVDFVGSFILFNKLPFWLMISTGKSLSSPKKLGLLKEAIGKAEFFDDKTKSRIADCFAQVEQCRAYRNAIIHHHIYDHEKGIGSYVDDSNSSYQIIVTMEALGILYKILSCLLDELREIDLLFRIETDAQRPGRLHEKTGEFVRLTDDEIKKNVLPHNIKRLAAFQKTRKELQNLPTFPDADLIRALNEQASTAEDQ
jgi:hypothetical protein